MILKLLNSRVIKLGGARTTLEENVFSTATTSDVVSDYGFSGADNHLLFGEFGDENSEIVGFTSTTGNTLTHAALEKDHPIGTPVYLIKADQVQFERSATSGGTYSELDKVDINPEDLYTVYEDNTNSTGFGRAIFYNSDATATYGSYYEIIKYSKDNRRTRGFAKMVALDEMGAIIDSSITEDFLNDQITMCDDFIRESRIRWEQETMELTVNPELGINTYSISSYVKDDNDVGNILSAFIGGKELKVIKRDEFMRELGSAVRTTLATAITSTSDTEIEVTNSLNLADEGSITIEGDSIAYTDNDKDTNTLSGVTGISELHGLTTDDGNDTEVWQGHSTGTPMYLTLIDGSIQIYPVIEAEAYIEKIDLDIVKTYTNITLDSDELAFPSYLYVSYLCYKIAKRRGDTDWRELQSVFDRDLLSYKMKNGSTIRRQIEPNNPNIYTTRR